MPRKRSPKKSKKKRKYGGTSTKCPLQKGAIDATVVHLASGKGVANLKVRLEEKKKNETTNEDGWAGFKDLAFGDYTVTLLKVPQNYRLSGSNQEETSVAAGSNGYALFVLKGPAKLTTKVFYV